MPPETTGLDLSAISLPEFSPGKYIYRASWREGNIQVEAQLKVGNDWHDKTHCWYEVATTAYNLVTVALRLGKKQQARAQAMRTVLKEQLVQWALAVGFRPFTMPWIAGSEVTYYLLPEPEPEPEPVAAPVAALEPEPQSMYRSAKRLRQSRQRPATDVPRAWGNVIWPLGRRKRSRFALDRLVIQGLGLRRAYRAGGILYYCFQIGSKYD
jgi:hypothetical protein